MTHAISESPTTSFGQVRQIEAGVLSVGYLEAGPADGPAAVLLHGWPYDVHSFGEVTQYSPPLAFTSWSRIYAATGAPGSSQLTPHATASRPRWRSTRPP